MENNPLILKNLSCIRGGREVFSNLSIELKCGEALLVRGENGAGKTTLLRQLAGLLPGEPSHAYGSDLHFIGAQDGVKAYLTIKENLNFWREMYDGGDTDSALRFWDLHELKDMQAGLLSSGQRKRLALCRLLLARRTLWLLDEPQAMLDEKNRGRLLGLLSHHLSAGGMAVIAAHDTLDVPAAKILQLGAAS